MVAPTRPCRAIRNNTPPNPRRTDNDVQSLAIKRRQLGTIDTRR